MLQSKAKKTFFILQCYLSDNKTFINMNGICWITEDMKINGSLAISLIFRIFYYKSSFTGRRNSNLVENKSCTFFNFLIDINKNPKSKAVNIFPLFKIKLSLWCSKNYFRIWNAKLDDISWVILSRSRAEIHIVYIQNETSDFCTYFLRILTSRYLILAVFILNSVCVLCRSALNFCICLFNIENCSMSSLRYFYYSPRQYENTY